MRNFPIIPEQASGHARELDALFFTITGLLIFFTLLVVVLVAIFAVRYRAGSKASRKGQMDSHLGLELTWTVIPLVLGVVIFVFA